MGSRVLPGPLCAARRRFPSDLLSGTSPRRYESLAALCAPGQTLTLIARGSTADLISEPEISLAVAYSGLSEMDLTFGDPASPDDLARREDRATFERPLEI